MSDKKRMCYTSASLDNALKAINDGVMSITKAAKSFNIPKTTLIDKKKHKYLNNIGAPTVLTVGEEDLLVKWVIEMGEKGFPVTKNQLIESFAKLIEKLDRPNPFKNGIPGKKWYQLFLKRHPTLSRRISQPLSMSRAIVSEDSVRNWFSRVRKYLVDNELLHIMEDPRRIFNSDESGFYLTPKDNYVLTRRGSQKVYSRVYNDEKECLTTLITVSADGSIQPPMVLYPYKQRIPGNIHSKYPKDWGIGRSESGWMTSEVFFEYVANVFYPWIVKNNIPLPILYFVDGHTSHLNIHVLEFCKEKGIILTAFHPNATHILQPLDVGIFHPLKNAWKNQVRSWRMENCGQRMQREDFAAILKSSIDTSMTPELIKKAFHTCGLFPFDANKINYGKFLKQLDIETVQTDNNQESTNIISEPKNIKDADFLLALEDKIDPSLVERFRTTENEWQGELHHLSLFQLWKKVAHDTETDKISQYDAEYDSGEINSEIIAFYENLWSNNAIEAVIDEHGAVNIINKSSEDLKQKTPQKHDEHQDNFTSPFKTSLYWPETCIKKRKADNSKDKLTRSKKIRITPAVAINVEYITHQRNIQEEKDEKERRKIEKLKKKRLPQIRQM